MKIVVLQRETAHSPLSALPAVMASRLRLLGHHIDHLAMRASDLRSQTDLPVPEPEVIVLDGAYPTDLIQEITTRYHDSIPLLYGSAGLHALEHTSCLCLFFDPAQRTIDRLFDDALPTRICREPAMADDPCTASSQFTWHVAIDDRSHFAVLPQLLFKTRGASGDTRIDGGENGREPLQINDRLDPAPRDLIPPMRRPRPGNGLESLAIDRVALSSTAPPVGFLQTTAPSRASAPTNPSPSPGASAGGTSRHSAGPAKYTDRAWNIVRNNAADTFSPNQSLLDTQRSHWRAAQPLAGERADDRDALLEQMRAWHRLGSRYFTIETANPWREIRNALLRLEDEVLDGLRLDVTASLPSLRLEEQTIRELAREAALHDVQIHITGLLFPGFHDRVIRWLVPGTSHWDLRWTAAFLQSLEREFGREGFSAIQGHRLVLFDPWSTLEELDETLAAIDDEAPFLRAAVSLDARLPLHHPYEQHSLAIQQAGLLRVTPAGRLDFEILDEPMRTFVEVAAAGLAPIFEALGRFESAPGQWRDLQTQAIFSWFRELSSAMREGADVHSTWGRIVAKVVQHLAVDPRDPN